MTSSISEVPRRQSGRFTQHPNPFQALDYDTENKILTIKFNGPTIDEIQYLIDHLNTKYKYDKRVEHENANLNANGKQNTQNYIDLLAEETEGDGSFIDDSSESEESETDLEVVEPSFSEGDVSRTSSDGDYP